MAGFFKKTISHFLLWGFFMLVTTLPLLWLGLNHPMQLQTIQSIISQHTLIFIVIRWLIILSLFLCWPHLITWISHHRHWSSETTLFWKRQRIRITIWLCLFEILICEHLIFTFIHF